MKKPVSGFYHGNVEFQIHTTVRGGNVSNITQGTWMHEDVAIEFARVVYEFLVLVQ